jgi:hypothetical protein
MLSVEIAWASRVWALPFLSVLAPSESVMARPAGQAPREKKPRVGLADAVGAEALLYPQREIVATADLAARPYRDRHDKTHARAFMERLTDAICYAA